MHGGLGSQSHLGQPSQDLSACAAGIRCPAHVLLDVGTFLAHIWNASDRMVWWRKLCHFSVFWYVLVILDPRSVDVKKYAFRLQRFSCREKSFQCPKDMYPYWHQEKRGLDFEGMMAGIEKMKESLSHFFECLSLLLEVCWN